MKYRICSALLISIIHLSITAHTVQPIVFEKNKGLVELMDGLSWGIDGIGLHFINQIITKIEAIQLGLKAKDGNIIGKYIINNKRYSIHDLTTIENQFDDATIKPLLEQAKKDFGSIVFPFLENAKGVKHLIIPLIAESCEKHLRKDSVLLEWAKSNEEGSEEKLFITHGTSFKALDSFCSDLTSYLEDLIHNCPKAQKQYAKLKEEWEAKKKQEK